MYIREQFYRFLRGCKPRENISNCSRKYPKMLKTDSFLGNKATEYFVAFLDDISIIKGSESLDF